LTMNGGPDAKNPEANIQRVSVLFPHTVFLDQSHLNNVCTRVQFAAGEGNGTQCPAGSVYGNVKVFTPLLDGPLTGNVYLRTNPEHNLPDLVLALVGPASAPFRLDLVSRIDSKNGGIRSTFDNLPDAPVSKVVLRMAGGHKGLIENAPPYPDNSICESRNFTYVRFVGQNGKVLEVNPELKPVGCPKPKGHHKKH
jgi:hypothetical protein